MERIRVVVFGCLLALGLSFCPTVAYASDGFVGGLEDLIGSREVETESYEDVYQRDYEPDTSVRDTGAARALGEDATTVDYINDTVAKFNQVKIGNTNSTLQNGIRWLLQSTVDGVQFVVIPAGIVFMWWGVRKSVKLLMSSFRKGRMSL